MTRSPRTHDPLLVWKLTAVTTTLALVVIIYGVALEDPEFRASLERVEQSPFTEPKVLIIGNSLVASAFEHTHPPLLMSGFRVHPLSQGGLRLESIEPLFDRVLATKPHTIIFEIDCFLQQPVRHERIPAPLRTTFRAIKQTGQRLSASLRTALLTPDRQTIAPGQIAVTSSIAGMPLSPVRRNLLLAETQERWRIRSLEQGAGLRMVQRAREAGIRVGLLELPLAKAAADLAPNGFIEERRRIAREAYQQEDPYLSFHTLDEPHYTDLRHLSVSGQFIFLRWLESQLAVVQEH